MASDSGLIKLAELKDLPNRTSMVAYLPDGREIALFNLDGCLYGLDNECPHMGGPLGEGEIEDSCIICPWHGWQFNIKTGECINMPGEDVKKIELVIRGEEIFMKDQK